jgi:hypothetical protein
LAAGVALSVAEGAMVAAASALVDPLRADDCRAAFLTIASGSRLSYGGLQGFCDKLEDTLTAGPEGFGSRLQADPAADPVRLGATRTRPSTASRPTRPAIGR